MKKQSIKDRQLWIPTYREVAPLFEAFYKDKYSNEYIQELILFYKQGCFRSFDTLMANPKEDTLDVQLSIICSDFVEDKNMRLAIEIATLKFYRNKLTIEKLQDQDIFNIIYKRLEKHNQLPNRNVIISARIVDESGKPIDVGGSTTRVNSSKCSFKWLGTNVNDNLINLYHSLKDEELISADSTVTTFLNVFKNQPIESIEEKIKWISTKKLCVYFIDKLIFEGFIEENQPWNKLEYLFIDRQGKKMTNGAINRSKIYSKGAVPSYPNDSLKIDEIIKNIT